MADFSGNQPRDWFPPSGQIAPGAMSHVFGGNANIRATVARDASELRKYVPKASYSINWHGLDETFEKGVARLVSAELFDYLMATEDQNRPQAGTRAPNPAVDLVEVVALVDFELSWTPPAKTAEATPTSLEERIAALERGSTEEARRAAAHQAQIASHFPPRPQLFRFKAGVAQAIPPSLAAFLRGDPSHSVLIK
jgi:hypothetical protein